MSPRTTGTSASAAAAPAPETARRPAASTRADVPSANPGKRTSNIIVEAALSRVRKATETANRAALPKIEPARTPRNASVVVDRQATARALEPSVDQSPRPGYGESLPDYAAMPAALPEHVDAFDPAPSEVPSFAELPEGPITAIDEIEPRDYLEAEVRKVDKALGLEFARNESPSLATHLIINIIDIAAIGISCAPFFVLMSLNGGSMAQRSTRLAVFAIVGLVSFLYLSMTQSLGGKTFGMMVTNTRVVEAHTFEHASAVRYMVRSFAYMLGMSLAGAGVLWAATNRKHRGLQDLISGTLVARDF